MKKRVPVSVEWRLPRVKLEIAWLAGSKEGYNSAKHSTDGLREGEFAAFRLWEAAVDG